MIKNTISNTEKTKKFSKLGSTKLAINSFFFATLLSFLVVFVGEYLTNLYGTAVLHGAGVILFGAGWICWMTSSQKDGYLNPQFFMTILLVIAAPICLPSILTFVMSAIIIIIASGYPVIKEYLE